MTKITIKRKKKSGEYIFEGHAKDASVCAGISTLFYTATGYAENNSNEIAYKSETYPAEGNARLYMKAKPGGKRKLNTLMDFLDIGLLQIAITEPDECEVINK